MYIYIYIHTHTYVYPLRPALVTSGVHRCRHALRRAGALVLGYNVFEIM